jgi:hypothetical protein
VPPDPIGSAIGRLARAVSEVVRERTGAPITDSQAKRAIRVILNRPRTGAIRHLESYIRSAVANEDDLWAELLCPTAEELEALLPDDTTASFAALGQRPPWCGKCHPGTRQWEDDNGDPHRCASCNPAVAA